MAKLGPAHVSEACDGDSSGQLLIDFASNQGTGDYETRQLYLDPREATPLKLLPAIRLLRTQTSD